MEQIPYIVYEQAEVRHERTVKRLIVAKARKRFTVIFGYDNMKVDSY